MSKEPSFRDLTKLSAYLDGELNASASRKMKSRLARDPNLLSALDDLRETKSILQRIPKRPSPRNFTLSPQMVAKRPPMPRLIPVLNYASVLAILLLFITFLPPIGFGAMAPKNAAPEIMLVESADMAIEEPAEESQAFEAPAAQEALAEEAAAPAAEEPADEVSETEESMRMEDAAETYAEDTEEDALNVPVTAESTSQAGVETGKTAAGEEEGIVAPSLPTDESLGADDTVMPTVESAPETASPPLFNPWQEILLAVIIFFPALAYILRRAIIAKWQKKEI